jgi:hypothetical protein
VHGSCPEEGGLLIDNAEIEFGTRALVNLAVWMVSSRDA